jgi:hypothetical protein
MLVVDVACEGVSADYMLLLFAVVFCCKQLPSMRAAGLST